MDICIVGTRIILGDCTQEEASKAVDILKKRDCLYTVSTTGGGMFDIHVFLKQEVVDKLPSCPKLSCMDDLTRMLE